MGFRSILTHVKTIYHKYIDIQYNILLKIFLKLFPKETPESTDEKISKLKAGSKLLMKKLVIFTFVLMQCYLIGVFFHFVLYYFLIPSVNQETSLNFYKSKEKGYLANFINPYSGNNLCTFNKFDSGNIDLEENFTIQKKQLCGNSFKLGNENSVYLAREFYKITLRLILPNVKENYNFGSFGVNAFFVNKNGEINKFSALSSLHHQPKRFILKELFYRFLIYVGYHEDHKEMHINFFDVIPNHSVETQAIVIQIPEPGLVIFDAILLFEAKLYGIRYYFYYWFWCAWLIVINAVAWSLFLTFFIITTILQLLPNPIELLIKKLA